MRADVAELDDPVLAEPPLPVEEPALAVLRLDGRVDDEAGGADRRLAGPALHAALRVQAAARTPD